MIGRIGILGGTGPEGSGLALRLALAGHEIVIGSRAAERAQETARLLNARLARLPSAPIAGMDNAATAERADTVVLALPFTAVERLLADIAPALSGKMLVDVVNPLQLTDGLFTLLPVADGSAAEMIQRLLPDTAVVSALKNRSARELTDIHQPLVGDSLICSDRPEAARSVEGLISSLPRLRAVNAGPLRVARHVESLTALLLNLNRHYRTNTAVQILGLKIPRPGSAAAAVTRPPSTWR